MILIQRMKHNEFPNLRNSVIRESGTRVAPLRSSAPTSSFTRRGTASIQSPRRTPSHIIQDSELLVSSLSWSEYFPIMYVLISILFFQLSNLSFSEFLRSDESDVIFVCRSVQTSLEHSALPRRIPSRGSSLSPVPSYPRAAAIFVAVHMLL